MRYLLSKKFLLIAVISLLIVGGGFFILKNYGSGKPRQSAEQKLSSASEPVITQEINKDGDNDGLKDWEEALWKTDPQNPDTDKDGTLDGQEIRENRNPLLAGNGKTDKIEGLKPEKIAKETDSFLSAGSSTSLTDAIAKQLFSDYLNFKLQKKGEMTEEDKTAFLDSFLEKFQKSNAANQAILNRPLFTKSDIKILKTENQNTIKEYGNNLALIIKKYFDTIPEDEMAIFEEAAKKEDREKLNELSPIISAYKNSTQEMLSLPAPLSFSENHLALVNRFNAISEDLKSVQQIFEDPMGAIFALKKYQEDGLAAHDILKETNAYFWNKNITFDNNETGKYFEHYLD